MNRLIWLLKRSNLLKFLPYALKTRIRRILIILTPFFQAESGKKIFKSVQKVFFGNQVFTVSTGTEKLNMSDIPENGEYEPWLTKYLSIASDFYGPNKDALDIGANVGVVSLILSTLQKEGKVFAFEPLSVMYEHLERNIKGNNIKNVIPKKVIVSNTDNKPASISAPEGGSAGGSFVSIKKDDRISWHKETVNTISLDTFLQTCKDNLDIKIVKIDVECWEKYVLEGAHETFKKHQPVLLIEFNVQNRFTEIERHAKKQFEEMRLLFEHIFLIDRMSYNLIPIKSYSDLRGTMLTGHFVEDLLCFNDKNFLAQLKPHITDITYSCYHAAKLRISSSKIAVFSFSQYPDNWTYGHDYFLVVNPVQTTTLKLEFLNKGPHQVNKIIIIKENYTEEIILYRKVIEREFTFEENKFSSIYVFTEKTFSAKKYFSLSDTRELGVEVNIMQISKL